jgi:hypothetical protein
LREAPVEAGGIRNAGASDLTYRSFDWNRNGSDGKPCELAAFSA